MDDYKIAIFLIKHSFNVNFDGVSLIDYYKYYQIITNSFRQGSIETNTYSTVFS